MTSPANQQNPIPATNTSATTATSYASAAGAPKKPTVQAPLVAASNQPPALVGATSERSAQNAKAALPSPVNGKIADNSATPAVARGTSVANGSVSGHPRKSSLTMAATGPNSYVANGGSISGAKSGIQFGFDSPAMVHSTPQTGGSAPIPIPGGNPRVTSPEHSPSPIPQPSASGGRPPSGLQQPSGQMTFGSLSSDGERHIRQGSAPQNVNAAGTHSGTHFRRESSHSVQSDNPGGPSRVNFPPQGGRGRGGFNPHGSSYSNQMGYPPNNQFRNGPGQGRGMPPSFQPQSRTMPYPNSPQPNRSPALVPSMPNTPNMAQANMQPNMSIQTPPQYHYPPPMATQHQNFGYPPQQMDQYGRPISMPYGYNGMPYMGPPQTNSPGYGQQYAPSPYHSQSHNMSRSPSLPERPSSANHQNQQVIVSSTPQAHGAQPNPAAKNFVKPGRKSAAIQIKNAAGEVVDTSAFKQPASPAPSVPLSKTPPVVASTAPTPPPKSCTPAQGRSESRALPKTTKEIQDELKEKIKQATLASAVENKVQEEKQALHDEKLVTPEAKPSPAKPSAADNALATPTFNVTSEEPLDEPRKTKDAKQAEPVKTEEPEEDDIERMIREMEEADAKREEEEKVHQKRREAEKAEAKKKEAEQSKINAAEEDRKLREQEREMERLEEEKENRRKDAEASGKGLSVADALAQFRTGKESEPAGMDSIADKLADMKIDGERQPSPGDPAGQKSGAGEKRSSKPAALNLAPLNTKAIEPPQPSAALQSLKSARFLQIMEQDIYPEGIHSPNPALNAAVAKKGKTFKYDATFLLQFQKVFTEQPSLEFHQQVKSLISDTDGRSGSRTQAPGSARQGSRGGGGGGGFSMGAFNAPPPGRTLPPGTTSSDRLAMASGTMPRPPVHSMGSFPARSSAFPTAMSRTSSQSNVRNMPNSPRQSSRSTRGSRRNDHGAANSAQAAKTMPLTAGMEIKPIQISSSGWKPTSIGKAVAVAAPSGYLDPELVQRKVKAALNKMTPEKFDRIAEQILEIASQSKDESDGRTLRQVIQLTFEKATDEAHWASMYAKFCKRMLETMSPEIRDERIKDKNGNVVSGGALFRKYLLNRCQEEFERGWSINLPEEDTADKKSGEAALLSDEYYIAAAAKRRGLGLVQFIGELYKLGMLTERIMHECVHKLVDYKGIPDEAEIESLSKLLRTIGANLDQTDKGRPMMDAYFQRIHTMIELPELPSRLKFMLLDVLDLRKANWVSKEANKGPKTLEEVRVEAEAAQAAKAQEAARSNQRGGSRPAGRGDARNFSAGYAQQTSNQVAMDDLRRLKGSASRISSQNVTLGPTSMFASRSNSGRRLGPGGSLGRPGDDSAASSRTGTPPNRDSNSNSNAFSLLATMETEHPASPPSAGPSPSLTKAIPDSGKKE
ncbi:hypothetical protein RJ55_05832 [Drechmeria coniospora]|nr:hypothetical protein RJ55_05832 [Drechmeria coniospora]